MTRKSVIKFCLLPALFVLFLVGLPGICGAQETQAPWQLNLNLIEQDLQKQKMLVAEVLKLCAELRTARDNSDNRLVLVQQKLEIALTELEKSAIYCKELEQALTESKAAQEQSAALLNSTNNELEKFEAKLKKLKNEHSLNIAILTGENTYVGAELNFSRFSGGIYKNVKDTNFLAKLSYKLLMW